MYSDKQVAHLRSLYATGQYTMAGLARDLGFSKSQAKRIIKGQSRKVE
jgi:DNA-binding MarR family transcriptional regulator